MMGRRRRRICPGVSAGCPSHEPGHRAGWRREVKSGTGTRPCLMGKTNPPSWALKKIRQSGDSQSLATSTGLLLPLAGAPRRLAVPWRPPTSKARPDKKDCPVIAYSHGMQRICSSKSTAGQYRPRVAGAGAEIREIFPGWAGGGIRGSRWRFTHSAGGYPEASRSGAREIKNSPQYGDPLSSARDTACPFYGECGWAHVSLRELAWKRDEKGDYTMAVPDPARGVGPLWTKKAGMPARGR